MPDMSRRMRSRLRYRAAPGRWITGATPSVVMNELSHALRSTFTHTRLAWTWTSMVEPSSSPIARISRSVVYWFNPRRTRGDRIWLPHAPKRERPLVRPERRRGLLAITQLRHRTAPQQRHAGDQPAPGVRALVRGKARVLAGKRGQAHPLRALHDRNQAGRRRDIRCFEGCRRPWQSVRRSWLREVSCCGSNGSVCLSNLASSTKPLAPAAYEPLRSSDEPRGGFPCRSPAVENAQFGAPGALSSERRSNDAPLVHAALGMVAHSQDAAGRVPTHASRTRGVQGPPSPVGPQYHHEVPRGRSDWQHSAW